MNGRPRVRLTWSGAALAAGSVVLAGIGLLTGYREFLVVAISTGVVLLVALLLPRVTSSVSFRRENVPRFVQRGGTLRVTLVAESAHNVPPARIYDQLTGIALPIDLPRVTPYEPTRVQYRVRAMRRGAHQLGPILEERTDPFVLATRTIDHDVVDEVLVHPVIHKLQLPEAAARAREAQNALPRFSDDPVSEFRSLREYVAGDDHRRVHWASSAKTGVLLVRDNLEIRRGTTAVVLETLESSATEVLFEDAVEIAASLVFESLARSVTVTARTRDRHAAGRPGPLRHREDALELYSRVQRSSEADTIAASHVLAGRQPADHVYLVSGAGSALIATLCAAPTLASRLVVVRLVDGSSPVPRLSVPSIEVESAEDFVARWRKGLVPR